MALLTDENTAVSERYLEVSNKEKVKLVLEFAAAKKYLSLFLRFFFGRKKGPKRAKIQRRYIYTVSIVEDDQENLEQAIKSTVSQQLGGIFEALQRLEETQKVEKGEVYEKLERQEKKLENLESNMEKINQKFHEQREYFDQKFDSVISLLKKEGNSF